MDCSAVYILLGFVIIFVVLELRRAAEQRRFTHEIRLEISGLLNRLSLLEKRLAERSPLPPVAAVPEVPPPAVEIPPPAPLPETALPPPLPAPVAEEAPVPPPPAAAPVPVLRRAGLEEQLGARLPVWIGSIALALAGAFLVKYSFERMWLSPTIRVVLGVLFGLGLLAGGEILRRKAERISQGLSAAGIADLFACFLAGVHLYGIISPGVGFALMALTTVVAVVLSLRQGIMVALIGLIGGLLTPYLMRTGEPNVHGLFLYLLLLQVGLLFVARRRGWPWIAGLALGGGLVWVIVWLVEPFQPQDSPWLGGFLLLSVLAALTAGWSGAKAPSPPGFLRMAWAAVPGGLLALGLLAGRAGYTTTEWAYFGLLAAGTLVLARLRPDFEWLAWIAAGAGAALLGAWGWAVAEPDIDRFLLTAAGLGILFAGGSWLALRGSVRPGRWGALCAASGLAFFLLAWASTHTQREEMRWGVFSLVLAALYLVAALPVARWRRQRPEMDAALAALAVAITSFVSLAVPLELERHWLTVAWALEVAALVWLAGRFRLPVLRHLAFALAIPVGVRLLLNASILDYPIGEHPVFHWFLYGYGLPLLAFAAAAFLARRQEDGRLATLLEVEALAFAFALTTLEVRQIYHPGRPGIGAVGLGEWGALLSAWILLGWGLLAANRRLRLRTLEMGGQVVLGLAAASSLLGPVLVSNPLWEHAAVGETPVFNLLLWTYGLPAALLAFAAAELRQRSTKVAGALTAVVLVLAFVLVSLEVRQAFHGTNLDTGITSLAEGYSYSVAWILFGVALLVLGILKKWKALRYAALAVMLLAIVKVFVYDTSNLAGLYRVFSFLGLGVSLLVLAWVYQRFVFREST